MPRAVRLRGGRGRARKRLVTEELFPARAFPERERAGHFFSAPTEGSGTGDGMHEGSSARGGVDGDGRDIYLCKWTRVEIWSDDAGRTANLAHHES